MKGSNREPASIKNSRRGEVTTKTPGVRAPGGAVLATRAPRSGPCHLQMPPWSAFLWTRVGWTPPLSLGHFLQQAFIHSVGLWVKGWGEVMRHLTNVGNLSKLSLFSVFLPSSQFSPPVAFLLRVFPAQLLSHSRMFTALVDLLSKTNPRLNPPTAPSMFPHC